MTTRVLTVILQALTMAFLTVGSGAPAALAQGVEIVEPIPGYEAYTYRDLVLRYPLPAEGFVRPIPLADRSPDAYTQLIGGNRGTFAQDGPVRPDRPMEPRRWVDTGRETNIDYEHDGTALRGLLVEPAGQAKATILVVHAWKGLGDEEKDRARMLAELGYRAFALDMYGRGVFAESTEEAAELAQKYYDDRQLMRGRVRAAMDALEDKGKLGEKVGAIGYCFGGTVVLECARSGMDLDAVVSFHGGLKFDSAPRQGQVNASVLVCNGYADPYVPIEERQAFKREMEQADADFVFIDYADAVHSFTSKAAGEPAEGKGAAYDEKADERSWRAMKDWFEHAMAR